jgi:predicted YcjX-like family ATPase
MPKAFVNKAGKLMVLEDYKDGRLIKLRARPVKDGEKPTVIYDHEEQLKQNATEWVKSTKQNLKLVEVEVIINKPKPEYKIVKSK